GGPYEVEPLVNYVKEQTDWLIALPTLPGHGVTLDLKRTSAQSWLMEAEVAYRQLQKKVDRMIIVGFSMGGLIAMYLALRYRVDKLILLSAAAKYISPRILLEDVRILLTESITKNYTSQTFRSEEHTSELQSRFDLVCRLLLEKKKINKTHKR